MTDSPELAAIRERDALDPYDPDFGPKDRRTLLRMLDEAQTERDAFAAELADYRKESTQLLSEYEVRVAKLEAHLRKADRIEGDIGAEQWYAERDALLGSEAETGREAASGFLPSRSSLGQRVPRLFNFRTARQVVNLLMAICPHCNCEDEHEITRVSDNGKQVELMCFKCNGIWLEDNDTPMPGVCKDCDE